MKRFVPLVIFLSLVAVACATRFNGSPHFPGGPRGCFDYCARAGLEMSSFVYSGEFASSCVCKVKREPAAAPGAQVNESSQDSQDDAASLADDAGEEVGTAAAVGVVLQMRAAEQEEQDRKDADEERRQKDQERLWKRMDQRPPNT